MEKKLEIAWVGPQVGWGRGSVSGIHQGGANCVSQVDGDLDMAHTCWLCRGGVSDKEKWPLPALSRGPDAG